jgi:hypothetical protein
MKNKKLTLRMAHDAGEDDHPDAKTLIASATSTARDLNNSNSSDSSSSSNIDNRITADENIRIKDNVDHDRVDHGDDRRGKVKVTDDKDIENNKSSNNNININEEGEKDEEDGKDGEEEKDDEEEKEEKDGDDGEEEKEEKEEQEDDEDNDRCKKVKVK